jgi:hypothetical protein
VSAGAPLDEGLDAIDRGLVEAGVMAAEALARIQQLERRLAAYRRGQQLVAEFAAERTRPAQPPEPQPRHLSSVPTGGQP